MTCSHWRAGDRARALEQELRAAQDGGQQVVEVVGHARGHLAERAQLLGAHELVLGRGQLAVGALALLEQAHAAQRQRGDLADVGQQPLVGLVNGRVAAAQGEDAERLLAAVMGTPSQWGSRRTGDRLDAVPRALGDVVVRPHRLGPSEHDRLQPHPAQRVADRRRACRARRPRCAGRPRGPARLVASTTTMLARVQHARHLGGHGVQQGRPVELARHRPRQLVEHRQLVDLAAVLLEEPRVLDRERRLVAERLQDAALGVEKIRPATSPSDKVPMIRPLARSGTASTAASPARRIVSATSAVKAIAGSLKTSDDATARPSSVARPDGPIPAGKTVVETRRLTQVAPAREGHQRAVRPQEPQHGRSHLEGGSTLLTIRSPTSRGSRLSVRVRASRASSSASRRRRVASV